MSYKISLYLRIATGILIVFSFFMMYYTKIVLNDYDIIEQDGGPTIEDKYEQNS